MLDHVRNRVDWRDPDVRRALDKAYYVAGISHEIERTYRQRLGGESPEELTPPELLARYLESIDVPSTRIDLLLRYAQEILGPQA